MQDGIGKIIGKYLKQYRFVAAAFVLFVFIFAGIFSLYDLELEAVIYAAVLCLLCGAVMVTFHFFFFYKKYNRLLRLQKNVELMEEELPAPSNPVEESMQELIETLRRMNLREHNDRMEERKNSIDYYTTWVHQIKAPIAVMRVILQGEDTKENQELLAELFRVEQYVEMVLCYFRLDSDSSDFVFQTFELDAIIRQAVRKFAPQFVRKRIRLQYEQSDAKVLTDEKWLLFIIEQVLSNALKYTKEGAITIWFDQQEILHIADTGIGIAPEDLPRIFEKGFTGYNGRADKKSTGLGLYLCKRAADKLSHRIGADSVAGQGTQIWINLHFEQIEVE